VTDILDGQVKTIIDWLAERAPDAEIDEDTVLAEGVIVDSFEFVELLVLVEELRGEPIDAEDMQLENFRSLRVIIDTFLTTGETAGRG
jgi:acyl carrier protein